MAKVLILYYSAYGHIERMAEAVAEGVRQAGAEAVIKRVPELVPEEIARKSGFKLDQKASIRVVTWRRSQPSWLPDKSRARCLHDRVFSSGARRRTMTMKATTTGGKALLALVFAAGFSLSAHAQSLAEKPPTPPPPHEPQAALVEGHLKTFDTLDFDVFSNQKWDRLNESHSANIVVTWPDGHETKGIEKHIEDLKALFVFAPDITIKEHPIRFGSESWTAVTGVMTGTFTKPMPSADGKMIPPTGKRFAIGMATVGHWSGSTMDHEWLFWDNQDFMKQIGLH